MFLADEVRRREKPEDRFQQALAYAQQAHAGQTRKGTKVPYLAHLLSVAALVLEHDGDQDEVLAALLHDTAEDQGGSERLADIRGQFGDRVAEIVAECSDTLEQPKPPWRQRKEAFLNRVATLSRSARLVSAADKLHNVRSLLLELRRQGTKIWVEFRGGREGTLWYYRTFSDSLSRIDASPLAGELADDVSRLVAWSETSRST